MPKLTFAAVWFLCFVIPWELLITFPGLGTAGRLAGGLAFGLAIFDNLLRRRPRVPGPFLILAILFVLWAGATGYWTIDAESTATRLQTYAQLLLMAWLIWEYAPSPTRQRALLQAYVLGAAVSAANTLLHYAAGAQVATGRYAAAGFNPNDLGYTLVLAIPMAWYLGLTGESRLWRWINRMYVPLGAAGLLLTASRGALIPGLVAILIIPWTARELPRRGRALILTALVLSLVTAIYFAPSSSWTRLATMSSEIESGDFSSRGAFWKAGFEVFLQHPLLGVGAGAFETAVEPILGVGRAPHQTFLAVLVGQGVIGLLLFVAMGVAAFAPVRRFAPLEKKLWLVLLLTLLVGLQPRTWDYRKPLWFVLGALAAHGASATLPDRLRLARQGRAAPPPDSYSRPHRRHRGGLTVA
jgi:O-antigen ligase